MSTSEKTGARVQKEFLWPLLAPLILILTYVGFYSQFLFCATDGAAACSPISAKAIRAAVTTPPDITIYVARASWTLANGLFLLACLTALFTAAFVMKEVFSNSNAKSPWKLILIIVLVAIDVALVVSFWTSKDSSSPAQQLLRATVGQGDFKINRFNRYIDAISLTATLSLACAASAILFQRGSTSLGKEELRRRQTLLRYVLYVCAALLVIAMFQLSARLGWGTSYLSPTKPITTSVNNLVTGIVNSMGSFYVLVMAAIYIPAALILQSRVKQLAVKLAPEDPNGWMTTNGFTVSFSQYLPRIIALLGPLLAGPLGSLLIQTSKAINGTIL
jgi:hypothetical protein